MTEDWKEHDDPMSDPFTVKNDGLAKMAGGELPDTKNMRWLLAECIPETGWPAQAFEALCDITKVCEWIEKKTEPAVERVDGLAEAVCFFEDCTNDLPQQYADYMHSLLESARIQLKRQGE